MKETIIKSQQTITAKKYQGLQKRILELFYLAKKQSYRIDEISVLLQVSTEEVVEAIYHLVEDEVLDFSSLDKSNHQRFYLSANFLIRRLLKGLEDHRKYTQLLVLAAEEKNEDSIQQQQLVKAMIIFNSELKDIVNQKLSGYFPNH